MAYTDWDTDPNANTSIDGVNIDENCSPTGINNALRSIMAGVASLRDALPTVSGLVTKAAAVFSGTQPIYEAEGALLHHNDSGMISGRVHVLAEGSADPEGIANGDLVFYYTP